MIDHKLSSGWIQGVLSFILCLGSCTTLPPVPEAVSKHGDKVPWDKSMVDGLYLHRDDQNGFDHMKFSSRGVVLHAGGQKNGPVAAPVSGWRLVNGRLFHSNVEGDFLGEEIHLASLPNGELRLRGADGKVLPYQVEIPEKKQRKRGVKE